MSLNVGDQECNSGKKYGQKGTLCGPNMNIYDHSSSSLKQFKDLCKFLCIPLTPTAEYEDIIHKEEVCNSKPRPNRNSLKIPRTNNMTDSTTYTFCNQ